jgi:rubrerythrin
MRFYYYCSNCGSEVVLQDTVWLGDSPGMCPLCGNDEGDFVELVPGKSEKEAGCVEDRTN